MNSVYYFYCIYQLTQELKKIIDDLGISAKSSRSPEPTIRSNLLKTSQNTDPERMFLEDLAAMENLSEDLIIFELQERMALGQFHTFIGDILLIINPNENQDIYGDNVSPVNIILLIAYYHYCFIHIIFLH